MAENKEMMIHGAMTPVWELHATAQQIDEAVARALPGGEIDKILWQKPGNNLLINSRWDNPENIIDQRGGYVVPGGVAYYDNPVTSIDTPLGTTDKYYTIASRGADWSVFYKDGVSYSVPTALCVRGYVGAGYTIDGWKMSSDPVVVLIEDGYIRLKRQTSGNNPHWSETFEYPISGTVTLSMLCRTNNFTGTINFTVVDNGKAGNMEVPISGDWTMVSQTIDATSLTAVRVQLMSSTSVGDYIDIKAAFLDLGPEQTHFRQDENGNWVIIDPPPNKALELLKCQRYFYNPLSGGSSHDISQVFLGIGVARSETQVDINIPLPCSMRATPAITHDGLWVFDGSGVLGVLSMAVYAPNKGTNNTNLLVVAGVVGATIGKTYELFSSTSNAVFTLDANL